MTPFEAPGIDGIALACIETSLLGKVKAWKPIALLKVLRTAGKVRNANISIDMRPSMGMRHQR
jgi:hypothetical protein